MTIHYQDVVKNLKENKQLKDTVDDITKTSRTIKRTISTFST